MEASAVITDCGPDLFLLQILGKDAYASTTLGKVQMYGLGLGPLDLGLGDRDEAPSSPSDSRAQPLMRTLQYT